MDGKKFAVIAIAGMAPTALPAFSQSESPARNEVPVQILGSFVKSATFDGARNSPTDSGGVPAKYRRLFDFHNGIEVNYGYALNTPNFLPSGTTSFRADLTDRTTHRAEPSTGFGYRS